MNFNHWQPANCTRHFHKSIISVVIIAEPYAVRSMSDYLFLQPDQLYKKLFEKTQDPIWFLKWNVSEMDHKPISVTWCPHLRVLNMQPPKGEGKVPPGCLLAELVT